MKPLALWRPALGGVFVLAVSGSARATLTQSEKAQIASYIAEGRVGTAERVRALVARPDLTSDESAAALEEAVSPLAFSDGRAGYLHEMLYGASSLPSRSVVAVAVTRAACARANVLLGRHEADLDQDEPSRAELSRIFAFIDGDVANAGQPRGEAHDPNAGIGASSYDDAARVLTRLIAAHPHWLGGEAVIPSAAEPVRAQLELALLDMTSDTTTRRFDAADRLGLKGSRRAALTELGLLVLDDGHVDSARVERVRALFARMPGARENVEAVALIPLKGPLRARREIVQLLASASTPEVPLFGDDVASPPIDPDLAGAARALAAIVVARALDARPELRARAERDAAAANGDPAKTLGAPANASARAALASAAAVLTVDAQTAVDLALVGLLIGRPERSAILTDALGAMLPFGPPAATGPQLVVGSASDASGTALMTSIRVAAEGFVTGFALGGHAFSFARDDSGAIRAKRDGVPVTLAMLAGARTPVSTGNVWSAEGVVFAKMAGAPRAGASPGGRVRLLAEGPGVDAIATPAPGDDAAVDASVEVSGEAAIVLRAIATPAGFKGIGLVLDASRAPARASIRAWDDAGKLTEIVPATEVGTGATYVVRVVVKGSRFEARVGATTLHAEVPPGLAHGDVALAARHAGAIEARGWTVKRP